ncbi:PadR family transcriptional regulator [Chishuiella sp.]|uniref:PadR family transcriptional regulator n=1 Tax=Chishuiella sp. TaxID=1969467 RepID=UPI0028AD4CA4|nr:PadR family transcriptional regulator [Chishuiella sp.]
MNENFKNKWISQLKKGTLSYIVLNILSDGKEYYGYELITGIKELTSIDIAEGTLYPLLVRLKNEELVDFSWKEQKSGIPRKYYTITKEGKSTFLAMKDYWIDLNNTINKL